jgi:hypothetical protein
VVKRVVSYALAATSCLRAEASLRATTINRNAEKGSIGDRRF